jgi:hypothetical protein
VSLNIGIKIQEVIEVEGKQYVYTYPKEILLPLHFHKNCCNESILGKTVMGIINKQRQELRTLVEQKKGDNNDNVQQ